MQDLLCKPVELTGGNLLLSIVLWTMLVMAIVYWWARKTTKHPEYAAAFEAAYIDPALRKVGLNTLADKDLVAEGQKVYARMKAEATKLEEEAGKLTELAKAKYAEAKLLRDRSGTPQA